MYKSRIYQKLLKADFGKICRFCLKQSSNMREVKTAKVFNMISYCSNVKITEDNDKLPDKICNKCFRLMGVLYAFRRKTERVDKLLHDIVRDRDNKCNKSDIINIALDKADIANLIHSTPKFQPVLQNLDLELMNYDELPPLVPLASGDCTSQPFYIKNNPSEDNFTSVPPPLVPIKQFPVDLELLHTAMERPNLKFNCSLCNEEFTSILELRNHKLEKCKSQNTLECNICHKQFKESKRLINHLKGHKMARDHECKICGKRYPNPSTFKVHFRTHTGERPYKCHVCNKGFIRWAGVINHMKTHEAQKPFKCDTCGKAFKIRSNLERHKILHSGLYPYCCSFCGKRFYQSDHLKVHIRMYHTNERPYLCNECGKGFVSSSRLKRHMCVHSGFKPYMCQLCPKSYSNSIDLRLHARAHGAKTEDVKKYRCEQCDMRFYHPCRLHQHVKTHEKQCSYCGKYFRNIDILNRHVKNSHVTTTSEDLES